MPDLQDAGETLGPTSTVVQVVDDHTVLGNRALDERGRLTGRQPRITFIVLSFNNGTYLESTLQSIAAQTLQDLEILITDDGSTDRSAELIRNFVDSCELPCLAILWTRNGGIARNYNSGLSRARGEFIAHIGSDDINLPQRLQRQLDALAPSTASMCIAGMEIIDSDSRKFRDAPARGQCQTLEFVLKTGTVNVTSPTMMYRRELLDRFGLLPASLANEDEAMAFRALCAGGIAVLPDQLVRYRVHARSISSGSRAINLSRYVLWLASNLPFQVANKLHWKDLLCATSRDHMVPAVDALLAELELKIATLAGLPMHSSIALWSKLLGSAAGRRILKNHVLQVLRTARTALLQSTARLKGQAQ